MPKSRKDFTGLKFGRLTVVQCLGKPNGRRYEYLCRCECGVEKAIGVDSLRTGRSNSCGCLHLEKIVTHGEVYTRTHRSWTSMKQRCLNPKYLHYNRYGGRGIKICDRWLEYANFKADMGERPDKTTLERNDNNSDYCPENCRWATMTDQMNNRSNTIIIKHCGVRHTLSVWCRILNIPYDTAHGRLRLGWTFDEIAKGCRAAT